MANLINSEKEKINLKIESFIDKISEIKPLIIAGPCSAESEVQMYQTAEGIASLNKVSVFRAGIWKPRTRPNTFEGVGEIGLKWLQMVKKCFGFKTTVEVANANHIELALKYDVDILWVGARTTVNPFSVQEIADCLKGVDIPVMVKNPIHPDLQLWIGALERINQAGIKKLMAIHRGFSSYGKTIYRNEPNWKIPIELKRLIPEIPILCDPSHICGNRDLLLSTSQQAIDLEYDGLMIETHSNPNEALSDAQQQITPSQLEILISNLILRSKTIDSQEFYETLSVHRTKIDLLDTVIMEALADRLKVVAEIGLHKKENNLTILQSTRWKELMEKRLEKAHLYGLPSEFIKAIYQILHNESIRIQADIMNKNEIDFE